MRAAISSRRTLRSHREAHRSGVTDVREPTSIRNVPARASTVDDLDPLRRPSTPIPTRGGASGTRPPATHAMAPCEFDLLGPLHVEHVVDRLPERERTAEESSASRAPQRQLDHLTRLLGRRHLDELGLALRAFCELERTDVLRPPIARYLPGINSRCGADGGKLVARVVCMTMLPSW